MEELMLFRVCSWNEGEVRSGAKKKKKKKKKISTLLISPRPISLGITSICDGQFPYTLKVSYLGTCDLSAVDML